MDREKVCVQVQNTLSSLIHGLSDVNANVSRLLSELVEREKAHGVCAELEEDEDGDEDGDEPDGPQKSELQPPAKRSKT